MLKTKNNLDYHCMEKNHTKLCQQTLCQPLLRRTETILSYVNKHSSDNIPSL